MIRVIILIFTTLMLSSCSNGWSIMGIDADMDNPMYTFECKRKYYEYYLHDSRPIYVLSTRLIQTQPLFLSGTYPTGIFMHSSNFYL